MNVVITEFGLPDLDITSPDPGEVLQGHPYAMPYGMRCSRRHPSAYGAPLCMKHMLISNDGASDEYKHFLFHVGSELPAGRHRPRHGASGTAEGQAIAGVLDRQ